MFMLKQFVTTVTSPQPYLKNTLTSLFRTLYVPSRLQQKPSLAPDEKVKETRNVSLTEKQECQDVFRKVNSLVRSEGHGRLFAVVHLCGKQFKITAGDIILVEGYWEPTIGDEIRLEKVLLAGAKDFTLIGRPILDSGLVNVKATIIEKTLTHTKTIFKKKRRKQFQRINFQRSPNTMIRINSIQINGKLNETESNINPKQLF